MSATSPALGALAVPPHAENFPVASWLCPAHLRPSIAAIYAFARTADDLADEGDSSAETRLTQLACYRDELMQAPSAKGQWPEIFEPLQQVITQKHLPLNLLQDLLSAFEQDVCATRDGLHPNSMTTLLDYCQRSANPVGRLLLHLYGLNDALALQRSDAICSALQLINFWQDLSEDIPRGRFYLPEDLVKLNPMEDVMKHLTRHALELMQQGAPLVHQVPGRAGWELRLVVQGGLRILEKVQALGPQALHCRPRLRAWDAPFMLWRAAWM